MPHAALWVVQQTNSSFFDDLFTTFQCRTRLCGWCSHGRTIDDIKVPGFNAARGFVGGAAS